NKLMLEPPMLEPKEATTEMQVTPRWKEILDEIGRLAAERDATLHELIEFGFDGDLHQLPEYVTANERVQDQIRQLIPEFVGPGSTIAPPKAKRGRPPVRPEREEFEISCEFDRVLERVEQHRTGLPRCKRESDNEYIDRIVRDVIVPVHAAGEKGI